MNFLIDECLHTSLVAVAEARGHQASHVTFRGWSGAKDWTLMGPIRAESFTFVTNNARDFRKLFAREAIHAGLVIIVPNVPPDQQHILFEMALAQLADDEGLINEALEVTVSDGEVLIRRYALPRTA